MQRLGRLSLDAQSAEQLNKRDFGCGVVCMLGPGVLVSKLQDVPVTQKTNQRCDQKARLGAQTAAQVSTKKTQLSQLSNSHICVHIHPPPPYTHPQTHTNADTYTHTRANAAL